jgi:hypothetical protein
MTRLELIVKIDQYIEKFGVITYSDLPSDVELQFESIGNGKYISMFEIFEQDKVTCFIYNTENDGVDIGRYTMKYNDLPNPSLKQICKALKKYQFN